MSLGNVNCKKQAVVFRLHMGSLPGDTGLLKYECVLLLGICSNPVRLSLSGAVVLQSV